MKEPVKNAIGKPTEPIRLSAKSAADYILRAARGELAVEEIRAGVPRPLPGPRGDWFGYDCEDENIPAD